MGMDEFLVRKWIRVWSENELFLFANGIIFGLTMDSFSVRKWIHFSPKSDSFWDVSRFIVARKWYSIFWLKM